VVGVLLGFLIGSSRLAYARGLPADDRPSTPCPRPRLCPSWWCGSALALGPAILTAFLIAFFPIMVNIATGLATLEPELEDVLRVLGARRWDVLIKVGLPRSHALLLRLAQGRHHAGFRRHRGVRDDGRRRRHRRPC